MSVSFEAIFESREISDFLVRLQKKFAEAKQSKELMGIVSANVFSDIIDHFDKESGPNGKWVMWTVAYARHMMMLGKSGNKILQDTGKLRNSLTPARGKEKAKKDGLLFYSPLPYSGVHDRGGDKMPQRQFMWLSDKAMDKVADQTLKWLLDER